MNYITKDMIDKLPLDVLEALFSKYNKVRFSALVFAHFDFYPMHFFALSIFRPFDFYPVRFFALSLFAVVSHPFRWLSLAAFPPLSLGYPLPFHFLLAIFEKKEIVKRQGGGGNKTLSCLFGSCFFLL